jgi:hypothetical protein
MRVEQAVDTGVFRHEPATGRSVRPGVVGLPTAECAT